MKAGPEEPFGPVDLGPAAARYESISRSRPAGYYDELLALVPTRVGRLMDAGCAAGHVTLRLSARAGRVVGFDRSHELPCRARHLQSEQGVANADWVVGISTCSGYFAACPGICVRLA
ncbi:MAG: hypothetical protein M1570_02830 [Chloroflexi bacterium]|nr:hypothetical protein [Chloroflexota bacterium]